MFNFCSLLYSLYLSLSRSPSLAKRASSPEIKTSETLEPFYVRVYTARGGDLDSPRPLFPLSSRSRRVSSLFLRSGFPCPFTDSLSRIL